MMTRKARLAASSFGLSLAGCICIRLLLARAARRVVPSLDDAHPMLGSIHCAARGLYVEAGANGWLSAASYSPFKPAAQFEVVRAPPSLVATLVSTREFRESPASDGRSRWDMRAAGGPASGEAKTAWRSTCSRFNRSKSHQTALST